MRGEKNKHVFSSIHVKSIDVILRYSEIGQQTAFEPKKPDISPDSTHNADAMAFGVICKNGHKLDCYNIKKNCFPESITSSPTTAKKGNSAVSSSFALQPANDT